MDGLLLNTEEFYSVAIQKTLDPYDCKFNWEMKHQMMGRKWLESLELLINHYKLPIGVDQFASICQKYLEALFPDAELLPGAEKLVRHLYKHNIPMCICTGSSKTYFEIKTS
uniref:Uncharacterized protein n=1 Tax=Romanomermis culicivorax TaxID=13658 RepID=A0A915JLW0_ROMCU